MIGHLQSLDRVDFRQSFLKDAVTNFTQLFLFCSIASWDYVHLANIRSPGHFDVQYEQDMPKLKMLMDEINDLCARQTKAAPIDHVYAEGKH